MPDNVVFYIPSWHSFIPDNIVIYFDGLWLKDLIFRSELSIEKNSPKLITENRVFSHLPALNCSGTVLSNIILID